MTAIAEIIDRLESVDGFVAAGAFTSGGELIGELSISATRLVAAGNSIIDLIHKARRATNAMNIGECETVHIATTKAQVLMRSSISDDGKHAARASPFGLCLVLVISPDGNVGLGRIHLENAMHELGSQTK
jgi:predicted regulator of Ras-like GTPase activity (Roadblock/LC7/MglB family)